MVDHEYECAADLLNSRVEMVGIGFDVRITGRVVAVLSSMPGQCFAGLIDVACDSDHFTEVFHLDLSRYVAESVYR